MLKINVFPLKVKNAVKIYRLLPIVCFFLFSHVDGQDSIANPITAIRELRQGYLVVRIPAFKNKIDTLNTMIARADNEQSKKRLSMLRDEAMEERANLREDYISAFQIFYRFSKVAYFLDHESRDLPSAHYFTLTGENISYNDLHSLPVFYLYFERTVDTKVDALVIYDKNIKVPPSPFPNNFTRGGFNAVFVPLTEKKVADWRVKRMNKKLFRFWNQVN